MVALVIVLVLLCLGGVGVYVAPYWTGEPVLPFVPMPPALPFLPTPSAVAPTGATGDEMLLALPSRGDADLYLMNLVPDPDEDVALLPADVEEEGVLLVEDAEPILGSFAMMEEGRARDWLGGYSERLAIEAPIEPGRVLDYRAYGEYGGFVPGSDRLVLWYVLEGDALVQHMRLGDEAPTEVMEGDVSYSLSGTVFDDPEIVVTSEVRTGQERCYVAQDGEEGERVAKATDCWISADGASVVAVDLDGLATTVMVTDIDGENEQVILDEVENVLSYQVSDDGSHVAFVQSMDGSLQLLLAEQGGDEPEVLESDLFRIISFAFVPGSDTVFYVVEQVADNQSALKLYVSNGDEPVAEGTAMAAGATPDGGQLVYMVADEVGNEALFVHPLDGGEDAEVLTGSEIRFTILDTSPPCVMARSTEGAEFALYGYDVAGGDLAEWFTANAGTGVHVEYVPGESSIYAQAGNGLYVGSVDTGTDEPLLEDWTYVDVLNVSPAGDLLVFEGIEMSGDDPALFSVPIDDGDEIEELDDDTEGLVNGVFAREGELVLYTAITGDSADDYEVRYAPADGSEDYEVLYEETVLVDARWDDVDPFVSTYWWVPAAREFVPQVVELVWTYWAPYATSDQIEMAENVAAEFNASQNDIELEVIVITEQDALTLMLASGDGGDIVGPVYTAVANRSMDAWLDLDPYISGYDLGVFSQGAVDILRTDLWGWVGLPTAVYPSVLFYNRDLFDAADLAYPPHAYGEPYDDGDEWTIEKMEELARLLTLDSRGRDANSPYFDAYDVVQFGYHPQWTTLRGELSIFGPGSFVDQNGYYAQMPDHWREGISWYYEGMWPGEDGAVIMPNAAYEKTDLFGNGNTFNSGNVAMAHSHLWYTCCMQDVESWDVAAIPSYDGEVTAPAHVDMMSVYRGTEHPEEAAAALYFVVTHPDMVEAWGGFPALEEVQQGYFDEIDDRYPGVDVDWQVVLDSLDYVDVPNNDAWLPNVDAAIDRINYFQTLYGESEDLDLEEEVESMVNDLQDIFDAW